MQTLWVAGAGHEEARAMLRRAAFELIRRDGARNLSMRGLATSLGISAMTAYRYYVDKEELFRDLKHEIAAKFAAALKAGSDAASTPTEQLRCMAIAYLEYALEHEEDYRLLFDEWLGEIDRTSALPPADAPGWDLLISLVKRLNPRRDEKAVVRTAHLLWSTVHGLVMLHLAGRARLDPPVSHTVNPYLDMLLSTVGTATG